MSTNRTDYLTIDGKKMPPLKRGGFKISENKIWSPSTGRSLDGTFMGSYLGYKTKLQCTFVAMDAFDVKLIVDAVSTKPFFPVTFLHPHDFSQTTQLTDGWFETKTMYAGDISYSIETIKPYSKDGKTQYEITYTEVTVDLIEQ